MSRPILPALPAPANSDILEKSAETMEWLQNNIAVGFTTERGPAWWANARTKDGTWEMPEGSHFEGAVPIDVVHRILDVRLVKGKVFVEYEDEEGNRQIATDPDTMPIVNQRTGKVFSYPSDGYTIHPYIQTLAGFINAITDSTAEVGSVGLLKRGGQAFLQAVLPEQYEVEGYGYVPYLLMVTSADMSRSTSGSTGIRGAVCDNTVNAAITGAVSKFTKKHTRNSRLKVQEAREQLGLRLVQVGEEMAETITDLCKVDVSPAQFREWLDLCVPVKEKDGTAKTGRGLTMAENKRERLITLTKDPKVAPWFGTAFGIVQLDNTDRTWNQTVKRAEGGRIERNFTNDANGISAAADMTALDTLAKVLDRRLVLTA